MSDKNEVAILTEVEIMSNPVVIFTDSKINVEDFIAKARESAKAEVFDITTAKGRKAIASKANDVAKMKVAIDEAGKNLNSEWKAKAKLVDADRKKIRDEFDALKAEVRAPLTEWEAEKAKKEAEIKDMQERIKSAVDTSGLDSSGIEERIKQVKSEVSEDDYTSELISSTVAHLEDKLVAQVQSEKDAAELKVLREKEAERVKKDAEEAEERERVRKQEEEAQKAKEIAEAEAQKKIDGANAEREASIKREKQQAEEAELRRKQQEEQHERDIQQQKENAEKQAREAEALRLKSIDDERAKIEAERKAEEDAERARAADKEHRQSINLSILEALLSTGISEQQAKDIVNLMYKGSIPSVSIKY